MCMCVNHSFKTRPGGSTRDLGLEPSRVEEKIGEEKTRCDPARLGQKPSCNPLTFVFFLLKRHRFVFLKKKN
jgi:hypothetical protein